MEFLKSPSRVAFVVALFVLAFTSSGNAQIRQNKLYIDNGSGTFLELVGTSLTGSTNRTIDFGNPQTDASIALTTGTPASGDILYWDNINKVWARLPVGTGVLQAGSTPGYGKVDLSSTSYVTGQLGPSNGGTGTTSLSSLATALKPYAANILPVNAAGVLTNDGLGGLTWAVGAGTGTVTGITAGTGLTGGTINSSGTIALDLTSANAWTGAQTFEKDNIKTTFTDGALLNNTQVSDATNTVQYSPSLELDAHAWNTTSSTDNLEQSRLTLIPTSGATTGATLTWQMANNGGAYSNVMSLSSSGTLTATTFSGSGANLTNIPAGQITGTLPAGATWNGNVIGATYGGLGADLHASAVGSVIYYDGAKFVALPPDAVVGKVLASNGTGAAPSWQSVTGASLSANNTFTGADVFAPTSAGVALSVQAAPSGSNDIFDVTSNGGGTKYLSVSSAGAVTIPTLSTNDATFNIYNNADNTKKAQFSAASISTGTTHTYTLPNADGTLALVGLSQTYTGTETFAPSTAVTAVQIQGASSGSNDIFDVTNNGGGTKYISVSSAGAVSIPTLTSATLNTQDGATGFTIKNATDNTKKAQFDASGISTGTTQTYTFPNASGTLALVGSTQNNSANFSKLGINIGSATPTPTLEVGGDVAFLADTDATTTTTLNAESTSGTSNLYFTGETADFTINGLANGFNGKKLRIYNHTGFKMTLANKSSSASSGNKIITLAGGDVILEPSGTDGTVAELTYDASGDGGNGAWILAGAQSYRTSGQISGGTYAIIRSGDGTNLTSGSATGVNSNTGLDGTLQFTMAANQTYEVRGDIIVASQGSSAQFDFGFQVPGTGASEIVPVEVYQIGSGFKLDGSWIFNTPGSGTNSSYNQTTEGIPGGPSNSVAYFSIVYDGFVTSGSTGGTCGILFNNATTSATTTCQMKAGSYIIATRIK